MIFKADQLLRNIFILFTAVFLLTGCANIAVEDFGPYWEKAGVDHRLLGWWEIPNDKDQYKIRIMNRASTLHVDTLDRNGWEDPEDSFRVRNLKVGIYPMMMVKIRDKTNRWKPFSVVRYKLEGDKLHTYSLNAKSIRKFLAKKHPTEKNITASCKGKCGNKDSIDISKLDASVYVILSTIPDTAEYWERDDQSFHKIL